jgi:hypothetical protein
MLTAGSRAVPQRSSDVDQRNNADRPVVVSRWSDDAARIPTHGAR